VGINPKGELFAFRDNTAPLHCSYIEDLNVCTLSTDPLHCVEFNKVVCKHNKVKQTSITSAYMLESYVLHTFTKDGVVETDEFQQFERYTNQASAVSRSLGSAGASTSYIGTGQYRRYDDSYPYTKPKYSQSYGQTWDDDDAREMEEIVQKDLPGIRETQDYLEDPALREAVKRGELTVRDIADIAGEIPNTEQIRVLEKQIEAEKRKESKGNNK
jgi:hypothetical protein